MLFLKLSILAFFAICSLEGAFRTCIKTAFASSPESTGVACIGLTFTFIESHLPLRIIIEPFY